MNPLRDVPIEPPPGWQTIPIRAIARRREETGRLDLPLLSVYRDIGVVPREGREDNYNRPGEDLSTYKVVHRGDLVLNKMKTWQGSLGVSQHHGIVSPAYFVCELNDRVDHRFLHHQLRSRPFIAAFAARSKGIRPQQWDLPWEAFKSIHVAVPPRREQEAIAQSLDRETSRIDSIVDGLDRLRDLAQDRMQVVIDRSILSCPRRVPLKREIEFKEGPGIMAEDFREGGVPLIRIAGLRDGRVTLEGCNFLAPAQVARRWRHFALAPGDYLLSASASMGLISRVDDEAAGGIPYTGLIRLRPLSSRVEMRYVKYFFLSRAFFDQTDTWRTGVGIEHYGPTHLSRMWMPLPPISEQRTIADRLDSDDARARSFGDHIGTLVKLLEERRRSLVTAAVTGSMGAAEVA